MSDNTKTATARKPAPTLYFIAGCKLAKGVVLLLLALKIFTWSTTDLPDDFRNFLLWLHLDPEHHFFVNIGEWLSTITATNVKEFAAGTFLYGLFLLVGGTGLALRARWAIWLTIGESAFFIPIEIFELSRRHQAGETPEFPEPHPPLFPHPKIGLAVVLGLNILVVLYLYVNRQRLFRQNE